MSSTQSNILLQWNLDLMKCQGTREIGLLYQGSFPYILKGQAVEYLTIILCARVGYEMIDSQRGA